MEPHKTPDYLPKEVYLLPYNSKIIHCVFPFIWFHTVHNLLVLLMEIYFRSLWKNHFHVWESYGQKSVTIGQGKINITAKNQMLFISVHIRVLHLDFFSGTDHLYNIFFSLRNLTKPHTI